jgi:hypothetical protein
MTVPAEHLFRQAPNELPDGADPVEVILAEMDRVGVAVGMVGNPDREMAARALRDHHTRFVASRAIDPDAASSGEFLAGFVAEKRLA